MPEPRGKCVVMFMFVNANYARNFLTKQSHASIFIYVNNASIDRLFKQQCTFESSTFGSESVLHKS